MTMHDSDNQPLDLDKEYATENKGQVPAFLMVLLVLTSINVVYGIYRALKELFVSAPSTASFEAELYQSIDESGVNLSDIPTWIMEGIMDFIEKYAANAVAIRVTDLLYYMLLGVAVYLMFRLSKMGYYLYVIVNVIGVLVTPIFYGFNFVGFSAAIMFAILSTIFIALYSANRKHLY